MINEIYVTQLNKEFSIYGLITFSGENKNNKKLDLVRPDYNIKFQLKRDVYKKSIGFELAKVLEKKSYTVINNKILNFGLLRSNKNRFVGQKYKMKEIIDIVRVLGLQVESENYLNPISISMNSNKLLKNLEKYKTKTSIDLYWEISYLAEILQMKQILFFFAVMVQATLKKL